VFAVAALQEVLVQISKQILVTGFVQGVSYRKQAARVARHLDVRGWVRNVSNGSVEACLEGEEQAVDAVVAWCAFGPRRGRVDEVRIKSSGSGYGYPDFSIREDRRAE
jgi:acylphosphatase